MGAGTIGITRSQILTPPEFRGLDSTTHPAGRVGGARIELQNTPEGTRLGACYQQIPLRVMPPFPFDSEPASLLYLINLTAGLLDGDAHRVQITANAGTNTVIAGQSATRVHPSLGGFATQQWDVSVAEDACLVVLPGPTIPYRGCRYFQRGRAELAANARLLWGDVWLPGRYDRGELSERFVFDRIVQDFEVRRGGQLVYRDRFRWDGPWSDADVQWYWGGELASGSLFVGGPLPESLPPAPPEVKRSVLRLETGESCVRWVGSPAAVTADLVRTAMRVAGVWTGSRPWLIESNELSPNHWFSTDAASR
jgi:urease accessory protein